MESPQVLSTNKDKFFESCRRALYKVLSGGFCVSIFIGQIMNRTEKLNLLEEQFDVLIIGGGATGLGIAFDAQTRGFKTALVEAGDFAQATSSRATKLVHGGVRYLASGQIHLVYEALHERRVMLRSAPHLVQSLPFITPTYRWFDLPYYGAGLKLYDVLSGHSSMGPTQILSAKETKQRIPNIEKKGLKGSILYHDGQFDDARLALMVAKSAEDHGAVVLNYVRCVEFVKEQGNIQGAIVEDVETGRRARVRASLVVNATGIFVDSLRRQDKPDIPHLLSVSRGTHIVVSPDVLGGDNAIMVPKTEDGRVIFAIPWLGKVVIGTTDIPAEKAVMEPGFEHSEIDYIIEHINPYLSRKISTQDVLSVFSGLRPLVTGEAATTSKLSREHHIDASPSGLVTVAGGKWTTYRRMAEDTLNFAIKHNLIEAKQACVTKQLKLHSTDPELPTSGFLARYGTDAKKIRALIEENAALGAPVDPALPFTFAEVVFAVREEMALTVEDVLSRRMRALLLDSAAARRAAPHVAQVMAAELGYSDPWIAQQAASFDELARHSYQLSPQ
jgi:glycerol-3-phosphate dehydrogenase